MISFPLPSTPTLLVIGAGAGAAALVGVIVTSLAGARRDTADDDPLVSPPAGTEAVRSTPRNASSARGRGRGLTRPDRHGS